MGLNQPEQQKLASIAHKCSEEEINLLIKLMGQAQHIIDKENHSEYYRFRDAKTLLVQRR